MTAHFLHTLRPAEDGYRSMHQFDGSMTTNMAIVPQFEMKLSTNDVTLFNNFTDEGDLETDTSIFNDDMASLAIHHLVKEGRTEEMYNLIVSLPSDKKHLLNEHASTLDYDGMAALHYTVIHPSTVAARILLDNKVSVDVQSKAGETPFHLAIRHGHLALANLFMDRGADMSKTDNIGNNALHLSIERNFKTIAIKILTRCPYLVSTANNIGYTPLHFAALLGDVSLCEKVLSCEKVVTMTNINGETPLHIASLMNHIEALKILIEKGCIGAEDIARCLNIRRKDSLTALHLAAKMGHIEIVRFIIEMGAKIDAPSEKKVSALALAAGTGNIEIMEILLQNGALVDATDRYGNTPLHIAAGSGQIKAMQVLILNNAQLEAANDENKTPLFFAVLKKHYEAVELLLSNGADCTKVDIALCSCLHYAVKEDFCNGVYILLQYGGDRLIYQRNSENRLALHEAILSGNEKILERLLWKCSGTILYADDNKTLIHFAAEHGKLFCLHKLINAWPRDYINMTDSNKRTALHLAAMNGHRYSVHLLIKEKADVSCVDIEGRKAHHLAILNHHNDVLKEFIDAKVEIMPDDSDAAILSDNVEAMIMLMDYLAKNYVSEKDFKYKGFDIVLEGDHEEIAEAIVQHYSFNSGVRKNVIRLDEVMPTMIEKYPEVALKVLDKGISFSNHRPDSPDFRIEYDFAALETSPDFSVNLFGNELYFGPAQMARSDRVECLRHPLTQKMMTIKWNLHGALVYYATLLLYLTFSLMITVFIILHRDFKLKQSTTTRTFNATQSNCSNCNPAQSQNVPLSSSLTGLAIGIFAFTCLQMLIELAQLVLTRSLYFKDVTNLYEWTVIISIIIYLNGGALFRNYSSENTELFFAAFCLIFVWIDILLFLRRSPLFNIYVVMFTQVMRTLTRVLFVFTPLLISSALVFHQLFIKQSLFKNFGYALMKTFVMLTGELEYSDTIPNSLGKTSNQVPLVPLPDLSFIMFVYFIVAITIALMNLLVGLAVGDIESIRKTAKYNVLKHQALYIESLHSKCPKFFIKLAYKRYYTEKPNQVTLWDWLTSAINDNELSDYLMELRTAQKCKKWKDVTQEEKIDEIQNSLESQYMQISLFKRKMENDTRLLLEAQNHKCNT